MEYTTFVEFIRLNRGDLRYSTVEALADDLGLNLPALLAEVQDV